MPVSHKTARIDAFVREFTNSPWTGLRLVFFGLSLSLLLSRVLGLPRRLINYVGPAIALSLNGEAKVALCQGIKLSPESAMRLTCRAGG